jgi:hypothetical protein
MHNSCPAGPPNLGARIVDTPVAKTATAQPTAYAVHTILQASQSAISKYKYCCIYQRNTLTLGAANGITVSAFSLPMSR